MLVPLVGGACYQRLSTPVHPLLCICLAAWCQLQHSMCGQVGSVAICAMQPWHNTVLATFCSLVCQRSAKWPVHAMKHFAQPVHINHLYVPRYLMPLPAQRRVQAHGTAKLTVMSKQAAQQVCLIADCVCCGH